MVGLDREKQQGSAIHILDREKPQKLLESPTYSPSIYTSLKIAADTKLLQNSCSQLMMFATLVWLSVRAQNKRFTCAQFEVSKYVTSSVEAEHNSLQNRLHDVLVYNFCCK